VKKIPDLLVPSAACAWIANTARRCLLIGLAAASVAACGGQSLAVVVVTRPARPVWCPTIFHGQTSGMSSPNPRVARSFDTRVLLGHTQIAAASVARSHGCSLRVVNQGGVETADGRPTRIDIDVNHGIITATGVG